MIPSIAYIIRISSATSLQYSALSARSCSDVNLPFEYVDGVENKSSYDAWVNSGLDIKTGSMDHKINVKGVDPAACCSVSHALIWKKIADSGQCAVVLEHDAIMLHPVQIDIPDKKIAVLGYKLKNPDAYNHLAAGPPNTVRDIYYHHGAHAYALTPKTARMLLEELRDVGGGGPIDNRFFLRERWSKIPLCIVLPTPCIGWIRESTIWSKPDYDAGVFLPEFENHIRHKLL